MTARFVILHHTTTNGEHWDLMIEHGEALRTWQLLADPIVWAAQQAGKSEGGGKHVEPEPSSIPARPIGDHRKLYLTYEGPISGDRGSVRRVEEGTALVETAADDQWVFRLHGRHLSGRFRLAAGPETWSFAYVL